MARDPEEAIEIELDRLDIEDRDDDARQEMANAGQGEARDQDEDNLNNQVEGLMHEEEVEQGDFPQDNAVEHSELQLHEASDEHLTDVISLRP